jgi:hypothetical protein
MSFNENGPGDELDDYIQQSAKSLRIQPPGAGKDEQARQKVRRAQENARRRGIELPDEVADDYFDLTSLESGRAHFNPDGKVKRGVPTGNGERAIGFSQIMPSTAKKYLSEGLDPEDEIDNIEMGMREFFDGDRNDPIARRLAYVGGPQSNALKEYRRTGKVSDAKLYSYLPKNKETYKSYVEGSGGFKEIDGYIKNQSSGKTGYEDIDAYIQQTAQSLSNPQSPPNSSQTPPIASNASPSVDIVSNLEAQRAQLQTDLNKAGTRQKRLEIRQALNNLDASIQQTKNETAAGTAARTAEQFVNLSGQTNEDLPPPQSPTFPNDAPAPKIGGEIETLGDGGIRPMRTVTLVDSQSGDVFEEIEGGTDLQPGQIRLARVPKAGDRDGLETILATRQPDGSFRIERELPDWLKNQTKPTTPISSAMMTEYNRARRQYEAADTEEFRRKFLEGFSDKDAQFSKNYLAPLDARKQPPRRAANGRQIAPENASNARLAGQGKQSPQPATALVPTRFGKNLIEVNSDEDFLKTPAGTVAVDISRKPSGMNLGEFLLRQALGSLAPEYDYSDAGIERVVNSTKSRFGAWTGLQQYPDWSDEEFQKAVDDFRRESGSTYVKMTIDRAAIQQALEGNKEKLADSLALEKPRVAKEIAVPSLFVPRTRLSEGYAEKLTEQEIRNPDFWSRAKDELSTRIGEASAYAINPLYGFYTSAKRLAQELAGGPTEEEKEARVQEKLNAIRANYGSFADYQRVNEDYQKMQSVEFGARLVVDFGRSFIKTAVSNTLKGVEFFDSINEHHNPFIKYLPDKARPSIRNVGNLIAYTLAYAQNPALANHLKLASGDDPVEERFFYQIAKELDRTLGDDPYLKGKFSGALAQGLGSGAAFMLMGFVAPQAAIGSRFSLTSAALGAVTMSGAGYDEARTAGLSEEKAKTYGVISGLLGLSEGFGTGAALNKALKSENLKKIFLSNALDFAARNAKRFGEGGTEEFFQEFFQSASGKIFLDALKDEDPSYWKRLTNAIQKAPRTIGETATSTETLSAFLTGGLMDAGVHAATSVLGAKDAEDAANRVDLKNRILEISGEKFSFPSDLAPTVQSWLNQQKGIETLNQEFAAIERRAKSAKTVQEKHQLWQEAKNLEKEAAALIERQAALLNEIAQNLTPFVNEKQAKEEKLSKDEIAQNTNKGFTSLNLNDYDPASSSARIDEDELADIQAGDEQTGAAESFQAARQFFVKNVGVVERAEDQSNAKAGHIRVKVIEGKNAGNTIEIQSGEINTPAPVRSAAQGLGFGNRTEAEKPVQTKTPKQPKEKADKESVNWARGKLAAFDLADGDTVSYLLGEQNEDFTNAQIQARGEIKISPQGEIIVNNRVLSDEELSKLNFVSRSEKANANQAGEKPQIVKLDTLAQNRQPAQDTGKSAAETATRANSQIVDFSPEDKSKNQKLFTERDREIEVTPMVLDDSDILTSFDEGFPAELQPRDRTRIASELQIEEIANNLNPRRLDDTFDAGQGRPILVPVNVNGQTKYAALTGNGRLTAIRRNYERGNQKAEEYRRFARQKDSAGAEGKGKPIYAAVLNNAAQVDLVDFVGEANEGTTQLSAVEQAVQDARRLDANTLLNLEIGEAGEIARPENQRFSEQFFDLVVAPNERGKFLTESGALSQEGINRIRNAIFASAFADSPAGLAALAKIAEDPDSNVRNIASGLTRVAGIIARFKNLAETGNRHSSLDISANIVNALDKYSFLRERKIKPAEFVNQRALPGQKELSPTEKLILLSFDEFKRSARAVAGIIENYYAAADAVGDPQQPSMFGDLMPTDVPESFDVWEAAVEALEEGSYAKIREQSQLFAAELGQDARQPEQNRSDEKSDEKTGAGKSKTQSAQSAPDRRLPDEPGVIETAEKTEKFAPEISDDDLKNAFDDFVPEDKGKTDNENELPSAPRGAVTESVRNDAESDREKLTSATGTAFEAATSPENDLPEPTQAQIEAGNYRKGHISINGLNISIENPQGSERKGVDRDGKAWSVKMRQHYGYFKRSTGADGENIDVFVKDGTPVDFSGDVFVIDQIHPDTGEFDEHKVMLGFSSEREARAAYLSNYTKDWKGLDRIAVMPFDEFKKWLGDEQTAPAAETEKVDKLSTSENLKFPQNLLGEEIAPTHQENLFNVEKLQDAAKNDAKTKVVEVLGEELGNRVNEFADKKQITPIAAQTAETIIKLRDLIAAKGQGALDFTGDVQAAMEAVHDAEITGASFEQYLNQGSFFETVALTEAQRLIYEKIVDGAFGEWFNSVINKLEAGDRYVTIGEGEENAQSTGGSLEQDSGDANAGERIRETSVSDGRPAVGNRRGGNDGNSQKERTDESFSLESLFGNSHAAEGEPGDFRLREEEPAISGELAAGGKRRGSNRISQSGNEQLALDGGAEAGAQTVSDAQITDERLVSAFDEFVPEKKTAQSQPPAKAKPTAKTKAQSAKTKVQKGIDETINALNELFRPDKFQSAIVPGFDEKTYQSAKPHFIDAYLHFKDAARDAIEAMRLLIEDMREKGTPDESIRLMRPYIIQFAADVRNGRIAAEELNPPEIEEAEDFNEELPSTADLFDDAEQIEESADDSAPDNTPFEEKLRAQAVAEAIPVETRDLENIRQTLPILLPEQQEDVLFAENAYFGDKNHKGVLLTNGTGTGKTFSGLGVIKRFVRRGEDNILVIAPSDEILNAWQKAGELLGINIRQLADTEDHGVSGVVMTTYANVQQNPALLNRAWDLVAADEAHKISSNIQGELTGAAQAIRAITLHKRASSDYARQKAIKQIYKKAELEKELEENQSRRRLSTDAATEALFWREEERLERAISEADAEIERLKEEGRAEFDRRSAAESRARVLFLSATPFAYVKSIDYAEGYLFDYDEGQPDPERSLSYNEPSNRQQFFITHFGYRMRYNKLTAPDAEVDTGLMERQFNSWLKKRGVLSGRQLTVNFDYSRDFVAVEDAIGAKIDEGLQFLERGANGKYAPLYDIIQREFKYHARMYLLEAIKAKAAVPMIKQHLALGRKVVVFHNFNKGGGFHPFRHNFANMTVTVMRDGRAAEINLGELYAEFVQERQDLINLDLSGLTSPLARFKEEFDGSEKSGGVQALFINGTQSKRVNQENIDFFNQDGSGADLLVVQSDKGQAGISLHDTSGRHQRVLINLGLPTKPVAAIQTEGRIYRVGNQSNAVQLYLNTGTGWERRAFAQTIAERASTAENLALGEEARMLKQSIIDAFLNPVESYEPNGAEGIGGRAKDRENQKLLSKWDQAKSYYFAQGKRINKNNLPGVDYFPTPEPIGLKMVEWANAQPGESMLEPSAGHGAIARWFPEDTRNTFVEPSSDLMSRVMMNAEGAANRFETDVFENLHVSNKYEAIVMNPPYGSSAKTAIEHLEKAIRHLKNGGRIVALIPEGPAADKRLNKLLNEVPREAKRIATSPAGLIFEGDRVEFLNGKAINEAKELKKYSYYTALVGLDESGKQIEEPFAPEAVSRVAPGARSFVEPGNVRPVAEISLPPATFERAATRVKTRIVVLEKQENEWDRNELPATPERYDFSAVEKIGELFDELEKLEISPRREVRRTNPASGNVLDLVPSKRDQLNALGAQYVRSLQRQRADADAAREDEAQSSALFKTAEFTHSREGYTVYVAALREQVSRAEYDKFLRAAKASGGWYNAYNKKPSVKGFAFKSAENRQKFLNSVNDTESNAEMMAIAGEFDFAAASAQPFFSQVETVISDKMPQRSRAAQIRGILKPENGVRAEEVEWLDLDSFLSSKDIFTRAEVLDYIRANNAEIREVELSLDEAERRESDDFLPKYSNYRLDGGANYKELLLTLPSTANLSRNADGFWQYQNRQDETVTLGNKYLSESQAQTEMRNRNDASDYKSSHFDEPNILAHVRFDERTDARGRRTLHVAEIQSDWHQAGRKFGYKQNLSEADRNLRKRLKSVSAERDFTPEEQADWDRLRNPNESVSVPDAPFKKSWHELAFKRILRHAVEKGFDVVSWDTGDTQAERYDLSAQVRQITYRKISGNEIYVAAHLYGRTEPMTRNLAPEELDSFVGKEIAAKITDGGDYGTVEGENLKIGGEGMKGFYDKILPSYANKLVKKWGARVEKSGISAGEKQTTVHRLAITPQMRESVMQGLPLFSALAEAEEKQKREAWKILQQIPISDLLPLVEFNRHNDRIRGNGAAMELVRRALEQRDIDRGRVRAGDETVRPMFAGLFMEPAVLRDAAASLRTAQAQATAAGFKNEEVKILGEFADALTDAYRIGGKTAIFYVVDDKLPHEVFHQAAYLGSIEKALTKRHSKPEVLDAHEAFRRADREFFSNYAAYRVETYMRQMNMSRAEAEKYRRAVIREEIAAWIAEGSWEKIGLDYDTAMDYLLSFIESYAEANWRTGNENALEKFKEVNKFVYDAIEQVQRKLGQPGGAAAAAKPRNSGGDDGRGSARDNERGIARGEARPAEKEFSLASAESAGEKNQLDYQDDGKTKPASLPATSRAAGIAADDVEYTVFGDRAAIREANKLIAENGIEGAIRLLEQIENPDAHHAVASFTIQKFLLDEAERLLSNTEGLSQKQLEAARAEAARNRETAKQMAANHALRAVRAGRFIRACAVISHSVTDVIAAAEKLYQKENGEGKLLPDTLFDRLQTAAQKSETAIAEDRSLGKQVEKLKREITELKRALSGTDSFRKASKTDLAKRRKIVTQIKSQYQTEFEQAMARLKTRSLMKSKADVSGSLLSIGEPLFAVDGEELNKPKFTPKNTTDLSDEDFSDLVTAGAMFLTDGFGAPEHYFPSDFDAAMKAEFGENIAAHLIDIQRESLRLRNRWLAEISRNRQIKQILAEFGDALSAEEIELILNERTEEFHRRKAIEKLHAIRANGGVTQNFSRLEEIISEIAESEAVAVGASLLASAQPSAQKFYETLKLERLIEGKDAREVLRQSKDVLRRAQIQWNKERADLQYLIGEREQEVKEIEDLRPLARRRIRESQQLIERELRRISSGEFKFYAKKAREILNTPRAVMASGDLSFIFRQGGWLMIARPKEQKQAFENMWQSFSTLGFEKAMAQLEQHEYFDLALQSGVDFASLGRFGDGSITKGEEEFRNNILEKVPGIGTLLKKSDETYTAFLDTQRMIAFAAAAEEFKALGLTPETHPREFKAAAQYINDVTGRSTVGKERTANILMNLPLFSPRFTVSRFKLLYKSTVGLPFLPARTRRIVARDAARFYGANMVFLGLAALAGLTTLDWDDDDFLKIKFGESRYDLFAGLQQPLRAFLRTVTAAGRWILGEKYSFGLFRDAVITPEVNEPFNDFLAIPDSIPFKFLRSKLSPVPSLLTDYLLKEDFAGRPFNWQDAAVSRAAPLLWQEFVKNSYSGGALGFVATVPSALGIGYQHYKDRPEEAQTAAEKFAQKINGMRFDGKLETEAEIALREKLSELAARGRRGDASVAPEIKKLYESGEISKRRAQNLINGLDDTFFESKIKNMPTDYLNLVRRVANDEERALIDDIIEAREKKEAKKPKGKSKPLALTPKKENYR